LRQKILVETGPLNAENIVHSGVSGVPTATPVDQDQIWIPAFAGMTSREACKMGAHSPAAHPTKDFAALQTKTPAIAAGVGYFAVVVDG
jgi:hypothetical protein